MFGITMSHNSQSLKVENWSRKLSNLKAVNSESICCWEFWFCFRENVLRKIHTKLHTNSLIPTYTHNTLTHTQSPTCTRMYIHTLTQNQARIHTHSHTTQHVHTHKSQAPHTHTHTQKKYQHCSRGSTKCVWSGSVWDPHHCPKTAGQSQHGSEQVLWTWRHTAPLAERRSRLKILLGWSVY